VGWAVGLVTGARAGHGPHPYVLHTRGLARTLNVCKYADLVKPYATPTTAAVMRHACNAGTSR